MSYAMWVNITETRCKKFAQSQSARHQRALNADPATRRLALACMFVFLSRFRRIRLLQRKSAVPLREVG
jgi:hypothetical protein